MQLELFNPAEIYDCFSHTAINLLAQANDLLKRLDSRYNLVLDCWSLTVDGLDAFYPVYERYCYGSK